MMRRAVIHGRQHQSAVVNLDEVLSFGAGPVGAAGGYGFQIIEERFNIRVTGLTLDAALTMRATIGRLVSGQLIEGVLEVDGDLETEEVEDSGG